jgi:hypothetical protein
LIASPSPEPKYICRSGVSDGIGMILWCDWNDEAYAALKALIEKVPAGSQRDDALKAIEPLGQKPYEEDPVSAKAWRDLEAKSQLSAKAYPGELAKRLIGMGCGADGAPYVIGGLIRQLDRRFGGSHAQKAEIARAFLQEANCPGAQGLSEENKAKLRQMRGPEPPPTSPGTASR